MSECPYCDAALSKTPQRKTKCPHCGKPIYVKRPAGSAADTNVLMTTEQAEANELKWQAAGEKDQWIRHLQSIGVSEKEFNREHRRLKADDNGLAATHHVLSTIMGAGGDLHRLKMAALLMVTVAKKQGRDPLPYKQNVCRLELEYLRPNARAVTISTAKDRPQCSKRWGNREFTFEEALSEMPLPCDGDCVCEYRPVFKWE